MFGTAFAGLAAHGDCTKTQAIFENVMGLHKSEGLWRIRAAWHEEDTKNFLLFLAGLEGSARERRGLHTFALYQELQQHRPEDVAAGLQSFTEGLLLDYLDLNKFVKPYICVSGGVFANVRLNMRLRQRFPEVKQAPFSLLLMAELFVRMAVLPRCLCIPTWAMEGFALELQRWLQPKQDCKSPARCLACTCTSSHIPASSLLPLPVTLHSAAACIDCDTAANNLGEAACLSGRTSQLLRCLA